MRDHVFLIGHVVFLRSGSFLDGYLFLAQHGAPRRREVARGIVQHQHPVRAALRHSEGHALALGRHTQMPGGPGARIIPVSRYLFARQVGQIQVDLTLPMILPAGI